MINPFEVIKSTEQAYHLVPGSLIGHRRTKTVTEARAIAMWFTRQVTPYSWNEIGDHFDKDHTTIIHNCRKIDRLLKNHGKTYAECVIMKLYDQFKEQIA